MSCIKHKLLTITSNCYWSEVPLAESLSVSTFPPAVSMCRVTSPCLSFWCRTSARFVVKRLLHPAVVQINVVSVTAVHDAGFCCDAPLRVAAAGEIPPAEECALDVQLGCSGAEPNTDECAETCKSKHIIDKQNYRSKILEPHTDLKLMASLVYQLVNKET